MTTHQPDDFYFMGQGDSLDWGGRYVGGKRGRGGDPVPGDVLVVAGIDGSRARWSVTAVQHPYAQHAGDQTAGIWVATVSPAPAFLCLV